MISGPTVFPGYVTGRATFNGSPVAGATVKLSNGGDPRITATATAPAGEFAFTDIEPGMYTVTFEFEGATPQEIIGWIDPTNGGRSPEPQVRR